MRDVRGGQGLEKPRGKAIIAPKGSITLLALDFAPENCAKSVTDRLDTYTPFVRSDRKPEPSYYPALAAFDIKVDRKSRFPVLLLAVATVRRTIANARLRSELTKGCMLCCGN